LEFFVWLVFYADDIRAIKRRQKRSEYPQCLFAYVSQAVRSPWHYFNCTPIFNQSIFIYFAASYKCPYMPAINSKEYLQVYSITILPCDDTYRTNLTRCLYSCLVLKPAFFIRKNYQFQN